MHIFKLCVCLNGFIHLWIFAHVLMHGYSYSMCVYVNVLLRTRLCACVLLHTRDHLNKTQLEWGFHYMYICQFMLEANPIKPSKWNSVSTTDDITYGRTCHTIAVDSYKIPNNLYKFTCNVCYRVFRPSFCVYRNLFRCVFINLYRAIAFGIVYHLNNHATSYQHRKSLVIN